MFITLHQNVEQNEQTNDRNNEINNICENIIFVKSSSSGESAF